MFGFYRDGGLVAWGLTGALVLLAGGTAALGARTAEARFERDVARMVFNDNLALLEEVRREAGEIGDSLERHLEASPATPANAPYIVVSIADHRLWLRQGDSLLYEAPVATGSERTLVRGTSRWRFETPRGRLTVRSKEEDPTWIPPDWHYVEQARKRGLGVVRLDRTRPIRLRDGSVLTVAGTDVVRRWPNGQQQVVQATDGREIVANGNIVIPPFGTNQRRYLGVLGSHRLNLGDGYALHGTNKPETVGRSVSHGCVRLRNKDIAALYQKVEPGTPVFIY